MSFNKKKDKLQIITKYQWFTSLFQRTTIFVQGNFKETGSFQLIKLVMFLILIFYSRMLKFK